MPRSVLILLIFFIYLSSGCMGETSKNEDAGAILLATTTSTYDSGLLDYLLPAFEERYGIEVMVVSVGSGQAIVLGARGDVDVILVHSPKDEERFILEGHGVKRHCLMYNEFIIVGPGEDPAGIGGYPVIDALEKISETGSVFVSRGDSSGTNAKELSLWERAGVVGRGNWYVETGTGMGQTLLVANEKMAYTMSDRATYVSMKNNLDLSILVSGDLLLLNPYSIIAVSPKKNSGINHKGAEKLISYLTSEEGQRAIESFTKNSEQLFTPLYDECLEE
ncbi:MAG: substrate-binding domain-containing protein [Candidatus Hydrothermarchaeaceae archaeon]